ncbi:transposase [Lacrimispora sp.]|uniref:IS66 family insertion sequence element accessory protein TnpA n=1 Tax=Lacrimispora sp. TaxID=2719234 RepID=UPI00345F2579
MLSAKVSVEEQYKLIMECRQSGLSDQQWCLNHDIKPGTFYNWVKRLRQRGGYDIPAPAGRSCKEAPKQEVVRLEFNENPASVIEASVPMYEVSYPPQTLALPVMELSIGKVSLRISNGIDQVLLAQTLKALKELAC